MSPDLCNRIENTFQIYIMCKCPFFMQNYDRKYLFLLWSSEIIIFLPNLALKIFLLENEHLPEILSTQTVQENVGSIIYVRHAHCDTPAQDSPCLRTVGDRLPTKRTCRIITEIYNSTHVNVSFV